MSNFRLNSLDENNPLNMSREELELNYSYNSLSELEKVMVGSERQLRIDSDDKGRIIGYSFCKN